MNKDIKYLVEKLFDDESELLNNDELTLDELNITQNIISEDYVDLGLPSGTLWCNHNEGADSPDEYGDYLAWDEAVKKYHNNLPTKKLIEELVHECKWKFHTIKYEINHIINYEIKGYKVIGKNGNSIFLPSAGRKSMGKYEQLNYWGLNYWGYYWTSDINENNQDKAYYLVFDKYSINGRMTINCYNNLSIRLIQKY